MTLRCYSSVTAVPLCSARSVRAKLAIDLENVREPRKPPRPESAAAFALGDERLPAVGVAVAGAVSVSVRIVRGAIAVGVRCIGVEPAETEVAAKSMAKAAVTPTTAPVAAVHRNTRPGESAGVRTRKAAAKMP